MIFGAVAGLGLAGGGVHGNDSELRDKALELMDVRVGDSPVKFSLLKHNRWHPYGLNVSSMEAPATRESEDGSIRGVMCTSHTIYCSSKEERELIINELILLGAIENDYEPIPLSLNYKHKLG